MKAIMIRAYDNAGCCRIRARNYQPRQDQLTAFQRRIPAHVALPARAPAVQEIAFLSFHHYEWHVDVACQALAVG